MKIDKLNIQQIDEVMYTIEYGYIDKNNNSHDKVEDSFSADYILRTPEEILNSKLGICWDQVELERHLFLQQNKNIKSYFLVYYDNKKCPTHTFAVYEDKNEYHWYEHAWEEYRGVHSYPSLQSFFCDIREKFVKQLKKEGITEINPQNYCLYEYEKPKPYLSCIEFYKHCEQGKNIN